jgi:hypothetical protein
LSAVERGQLLQSISSSHVPILAEDVYKLLNFSMPETSDKVLIGGKLGLLGDTEEELSAIGDPSLEMVEGQMEAQRKISSASDKKKDVRKGKPAKASELREILKNAAPEDITELRNLIVAAQNASHPNGEIKAVEIQIQHMAEKVNKRFQV